jgi:hypothetical protein
MSEETKERIGVLTDKLFDLHKKMEIPQKELEDLKRQLAPVESELLELMIMNEMKSYEDLSGRGIVTWDAPIRAEVADAKAFFLSLRGSGDDAVAKLQVGPDVINDELLEEIKKARPEDLKIGMQWNSLLAYCKSKIEEAEDKRIMDNDEAPRSKADVYLDEDLWLPGIRMNQNDPALKIKKPKK